MVTVDFLLSDVGRDDLIPPQEFIFTVFLRRLGSSRPTLELKLACRGDD